MIGQLRQWRAAGPPVWRERSFVRDAAQLAASSGSFQNQKTKAVRNRPFIDDDGNPICQCHIFVRRIEGTVRGILILAEGITQRKQMEEALSDMTRKLIESQEQERARIGRELHDDINQRLEGLP